ncbi:exported hypothetical protein [Frankia sp. Hr75.2]|nr:exported hypothetical protein [Frankia sp. Hr75.2]
MALLRRSRRSGSLPTPVPARRATDPGTPARRADPAGTVRPVPPARAASRPTARAGHGSPAPAGMVVRGVGGSEPPAGGRGAGTLPPSVARVAARTRLSAELLAALLEVEERTRATLDDIERADALADRLLARRRDRLAAGRATDLPATPTRLSA